MTFSTKTTHFSTAIVFAHVHVRVQTMERQILLLTRRVEAAKRYCGYLYSVYTIEQTSSKCIQNTRADFRIQAQFVTIQPVVKCLDALC